MSSWVHAQRLAHLVANRAHEDLSVPRDHYPVDVYAALTAADVRIMWQPVPQLLGAYLCNPDDDKGVLLNPDLTRAARHHTAAHELGHDRFGHGTQLDREVDEFLDSAPAAGWPTAEKEAETFAAWFLMPTPAVRAAMLRLGWSAVDSAQQVYQLSLRLGTHYRTTARHLANTRVISRQKSTQWARTNPGRLKASLDKHAPPAASRLSDVWLVEATAAEQHLVASSADRIAVELRDDQVADPVVVPPWVRVIADDFDPSVGRRRVVLEIDGQCGPAVARIDVGDRTPWAFTVEVRPAPPPGLDSSTVAAFEQEQARTCASGATHDHHEGGART